MRTIAAAEHDERVAGIRAEAARKEAVNRVYRLAGVGQRRVSLRERLLGGVAGGALCRA